MALFDIFKKNKDAENKDSLSYYDTQIKKNPKDANLWKNKGEFLVQHTKYSEAIQCFENAIRLYDDALKSEPTNSKLWLGKNHSLLYLGKYEESVEPLDNAFQNSQDDPSLWITKGMILTSLDRYSEGIDCYYQAIRIYDERIKNNHDDYEAWNLKGETLAELGYFENANKCFVKAYHIVRKKDWTMSSPYYMGSGHFFKYNKIHGREDRTKINQIFNKLPPNISEPSQIENEEKISDIRVKPVYTTLKSTKHFEVSFRVCNECGRSVKHTCISERRKTMDVGGMESVNQIWAIADHRYGNRKCRGSNRRYKKQFIK